MMNDISKKVHFFSSGNTFSFRNRTRFKIFVYYLLKREGKKLELINFVFCKDEELRKVNNDFLMHNYYTDILTFDLSEKKKVVISDIYISIDRIKENANFFHVSFSKELHRVMIHGLLHICGYKDKKVSEIKKIKLAEDKYLSIYNCYSRFM